MSEKSQSEVLVLQTRNSVRNVTQKKKNGIQSTGIVGVAPNAWFIWTGNRLSPDKFRALVSCQELVERLSKIKIDHIRLIDKGNSS